MKFKSTVIDFLSKWLNDGYICASPRIRRLQQVNVSSLPNIEQWKLIIKPARYTNELETQNRGIFEFRCIKDDSGASIEKSILEALGVSLEL